MGAFMFGVVVGFGFYYRNRKPRGETAISGRTKGIKRVEFGGNVEDERQGARVNLHSAPDEQPVGGILRQNTNYGRVEGRVDQEIKDITNNRVNNSEKPPS